MQTQFRIQERGSAYVPQKKILLWWKNLSRPVASLDAARRVIHARSHPKANETRPRAGQ